MDQHELNYQQITAATRQVMFRIDQDWKKFHAEAPHFRPDTFRDNAEGVLLLWQELTAGRQIPEDRDYLTGFANSIGDKP